MCDNSIVACENVKSHIGQIQEPHTKLKSRQESNFDWSWLIIIRMSVCGVVSFLLAITRLRLCRHAIFFILSVISLDFSVIEIDVAESMFQCVKGLLAHLGL